MSDWVPVSEYYAVDEEAAEELLREAFQAVFITERSSLAEEYFSTHCICGRILSGKGKFSRCWGCLNDQARDERLKDYDAVAIKRAKESYDNEFKKSNGSRKSWSEIHGGFSAWGDSDDEGPSQEGGEGVSDPLHGD